MPRYSIAFVFTIFTIIAMFILFEKYFAKKGEYIAMKDLTIIDIQQKVLPAIKKFASSKKRLPVSFHEIKSTLPKEYFEDERITFEDVWGFAYEYRIITSRRFEIRSIGEDGKSGSWDDYAQEYTEDF